MFVVVGERINTSRKEVQEAVAKRDVAYIQKDVKQQEAAGASYIDVNAGARIGFEMEDMEWLLEVIQEVVAIPLSLDSPDPKVLEMAYRKVKEPPMINSISLEKKRYDSILSFLKGRDCRVVALCMDDSGMPKNTSEVIDRAKTLVGSLEGVGIKRESIYLDPLVQPVSTDITKALMTMDSVKGILKELPGVHVICGLSNVSYGLPQRELINRTFLTLLMSAGLDSAILDPLDKKLMSVLRTSELLLGKDDYCLSYLKGIREGRISS
jgi:5-methyltetrahydrofolate--homocysteine methyltransferase